MTQEIEKSSEQAIVVKGASFEEEPFEDHLAPPVNTTANPSSKWLLVGRRLAKNAALREYLFSSNSPEAVEALGGAIRDLVDSDFEGEDPVEVSNELAQYLMDEKDQLGEGVYLLDSTTGRTFAILKPEDMYQPPPVRREGGRFVTRSPQVRPDLLAFLMVKNHDLARENTITQELATRYGIGLCDRQLRVVSVSGRKNIISEVGAKPLGQIVSRVSGSLGILYSLLKKEGIGGVGEPQSVPLSASWRTYMGDLKAINLAFQSEAHIESSVGAGLMTGFATWLESQARTREEEATPISCSDLSKMALDYVVWIAPPDAVRILRMRGANVVPVEGANVLLALSDPFGSLEIPDEFSLKGITVFDRWEVQARVTAKAQVDWSAIRLYTVLDLSREGLVA